MIVFDLHCLDNGDRFEAWFASNADFDLQVDKGLVSCPVCDSRRIAKAPMAPMVPRAADSAARTSDMINRLAALQAEVLKGSQWVGDRFAETARAMHLGEIANGPVHGEATIDQAQSLLDDGVPIARLPLPVVPPTQVN